MWEKELKEGDNNVLMCLEVLCIIADEPHLDENLKGRYGKDGFLYNIHYPINPETFEGKSHDWVATLTKQKDMGEY